MTSKNIKKLLNNKDVLKRFKENNVEHLYLVGSYSRWEEDENSDIDLIYEFWEWGCVWWFKFINMKLELEKFLQKEVDLVEKQFINKHLVKYLEKDKILIF